MGPLSRRLAVTLNLTWMDRFGTFASASCAAHCIVLSAAPTLLSVLGLEFLRNELFEWGFFTLAIGMASLAAVFGYRLHGNTWVLGSFATGGVVLMAGRFGEALGIFEGAGVVAILGGLLLVASHLINISWSRGCRQNCSTPS